MNNPTQDNPCPRCHKTCDLKTIDGEAGCDGPRELKACPFCGSTNILEFPDFKAVGIAFHNCISCFQCGATMLTGFGREESERRWNRRAETPAERFAAKVREIMANTGGNDAWKMWRIRQEMEQMKKEVEG